MATTRRGVSCGRPWRWARRTNVGCWTRQPWKGRRSGARGVAGTGRDPEFRLGTQPMRGFDNSPCAVEDYFQEVDHFSCGVLLSESWRASKNPRRRIRRGFERCTIAYRLNSRRDYATPCGLTSTHTGARSSEGNLFHSTLSVTKDIARRNDMAVSLQRFRRVPVAVRRSHRARLLRHIATDRPSASFGALAPG